MLSGRLLQNLSGAEQQGLEFMKTAGAEDLESLREISADQLQKLSNQPEVGRFGVVTDGYFLPNDIKRHFEKGNHNQVPVLTGWVTGDGRLFPLQGITSENFKKTAKVNYGAFHTSEVPFALHTLNQWKRQWKPQERRLEDQISGYWVNFAKTGNPNGSGLPEWNAYDPSKGEVLIIDTPTITMQKRYAEEIEFLTQ